MRGTRRTLGTIAAVLTVIAFVASGVFGLIHEATTIHVRCAQHGELVDSGEVAAHAANAATAPTRPDAARPDARDGALREAESFAIHGHAHCSLASATRASRVVPRTPAIAPVQLAVEDVRAPSRIAIALGDVLYRTAPKTSPPA